MYCKHKTNTLSTESSFLYLEIEYSRSKIKRWISRQTVWPSSSKSLHGEQMKCLLIIINVWSLLTNLKQRHSLSTAFSNFLHLKNITASLFSHLWDMPRISSLNLTNYLHVQSDVKWIRAQLNHWPIIYMVTKMHHPASSSWII